jgi:hypothetical protein
MHNLRPEILSYRQTYFIAILIPGFLIQLTSLGFGRFAYTALETATLLLASIRRS